MLMKSLFSVSVKWRHQLEHRVGKLVKSRGSSPRLFHRQHLLFAAQRTTRLLADVDGYFALQKPAWKLN